MDSRELKHSRRATSESPWDLAGGWGADFVKADGFGRELVIATNGPRNTAELLVNDVLVDQGQSGRIYCFTGLTPPCITQATKVPLDTIDFVKSHSLAIEPPLPAGITMMSPRAQFSAASSPAASLIRNLDAETAQ